jgi:hypothetical protein
VIPWHPRAEEAPKTEKVLVFSPCYKAGDPMRFRAMEGQFVEICKEVTLWAKVEDLVEVEEETGTSPASPD